MRGYPLNYITRELDTMRGEIGEVLNQIHTGMFLPSHREGVLPALRGMFKVDVKENADKIIVIADLPGVDADNVSVMLLSPRSLEISCSGDGSREEHEGDYFIRERSYRNMQRVISLPADVKYDEEYMASFKNGTLEVHLSKVGHAQVKNIVVTKE